jgi:hypothetical protein
VLSWVPLLVAGVLNDLLVLVAIRGVEEISENRPELLIRIVFRFEPIFSTVYMLPDGVHKLWVGSEVRTCFLLALQDLTNCHIFFMFVIT